MSELKKYDRSYKEQSVKLALEIGVKRAGEDLKVPYGTLYGWVQAAKNVDLDIEERTPENAMSLAAKMMEILHKDECNDIYGRERMHKALLLKYPDSGIPSEATVYRVMTAIGITHRPNRKPNGITKADREARKSDDLLKCDFKADKPFSKCVTDITEVKAKNGKLYVSAIFDCYGLTAVGLSMDDNMRAELCAAAVENTAAAYPELCGAVLHSDRGSQYTSASYRAMLNECGVRQSMNSAGGRCHDNARCESMWARMKNELFYSRGRRSTDYTTEQLKTMIWRYYMSYWNNRRICSSIGGMPPAEKRRRYYSDKKGKSAAAAME